MCGRGVNYCLIDTQNSGNYYCGADCSEGQACPRGYACSDVIVVFSRWQCTSDNQCPPDTDCRPIRCVDFRGAGGCLIGQNCTPANGLTCLEVQ